MYNLDLCVFVSVMLLQTRFSLYLVLGILVYVTMKSTWLAMRRIEPTVRYDQNVIITMQSSPVKGYKPPNLYGEVHDYFCLLSQSVVACLIYQNIKTRQNLLVLVVKWNFWLKELFKISFKLCPVHLVISSSDPRWYNHNVPADQRWYNHNVLPSSKPNWLQ